MDTGGIGDCQAEYAAVLAAVVASLRTAAAEAEEFSANDEL